MLNRISLMALWAKLVFVALNSLKKIKILMLFQQKSCKKSQKGVKYGRAKISKRCR